MIRQHVTDLETKFLAFIDKIEKSSVDEFIVFAKNYNIFQESTNGGYQFFVTKIKQRLDKEGLSYEIVRPE